MWDTLAKHTVGPNAQHELGAELVELLGRYEVFEQLGTGSMGRVHRARDTVLDRDVALKIIRTGPAIPEEIRQRFYREARACARLRHPGIVMVYDLGESEGLAYIAMELLVGNDLRRHIQEKPLLPLETKLDLIAQICDALAYAHSQGIVHRDIKPSNIFIENTNRARILDFGIARMPSSQLTFAGRVLGSPNYMAPEQILGKPCDERSDLFSVAIVSFELVTGVHPFRGAFIPQRIAELGPERLLDIDPDLPPGLEQVLAKALEKSPERRFENVEAFSTAWRAALAEPRPRRMAAAAASPAESAAGNGAASEAARQEHDPEWYIGEFLRLVHEFDAALEAARADAARRALSGMHRLAEHDGRFANAMREYEARLRESGFSLDSVAAATAVPPAPTPPATPTAVSSTTVPDLSATHILGVDDLMGGPATPAPPPTAAPPPPPETPPPAAAAKIPARVSNAVAAALAAVAAAAASARQSWNRFTGLQKRIVAGGLGVVVLCGVIVVLWPARHVPVSPAATTDRSNARPGGSSHPAKVPAQPDQNAGTPIDGTPSVTEPAGATPDADIERLQAAAGRAWAAGKYTQATQLLKRVIAAKPADRAALALAEKVRTAQTVDPGAPRRAKDPDAFLSGKPFSREEFLTAVHNVSDKRLKAAMESRRLDFESTPENLKSAKEAGASEDILGMIPALARAPVRAATSKPAAVEHGTLLVECSPPECLIAINGRPAGATEAGKRSISLPPGTVVVDFKRNGYISEQLSRPVQAGQSAAAAVKLKPDHSTQEKFGQQLFAKLVGAFGGPQSLRETAWLAGSAAVTIWDAAGQPAQWNVPQVRLKAPDLAYFDMKGDGGNFWISLGSDVKASRGFNKAPQAEDVERMLRMFRENQPAVLLDRIASGHMRLSANSLEPDAGGRTVLRAEDNAGSYVITLGAAALPERIRREQAGGGFELVYSGYAPLGKSHYPRVTVIKLPGARQHGMEFRFQQLNLNPRLQNKDFRR